MGFDELIQHDLSEMTTGIGNGLTGGNGSPVGIADGGVGNAEIDNSAAFQFNGDLKLGQVNNTDYLIRQRDTKALELEARSSSADVLFDITTADKDGTDFLEFSLFAEGERAATDASRLVIRYDQLDEVFQFSNFTAGSGTAYPIKINSGDQDQIVARTDGNVAMNNGLLVGSTGAATNALGVSGGAVVGSGFAGSNTAPTNGLLVEGNLAVGRTDANSLIHAFSKSSGEYILAEAAGANGKAGLRVKNGEGQWALTIEGNEDFALRDVGQAAEALRVDRSQRTILKNGTTNPGTSSAPILQFGSNGAGLFIDSNGDLVAVDDSGNTSVLT